MNKPIIKTQTKVNKYDIAVYGFEKFIAEEDEIPEMKVIKVQPKYILINSTNEDI